MPQVSPFTGLLFDRSLVGPLDRVTTPPYDIITTQEQRRYLDSSPHNIVRVVLSEERPGDDDVNNKYTRAASEFGRWRAEGVLVSTPAPAYYPYEMRFAFRKERRRVRGVICQVELEPWGGSIIPHERTLPGPIEDRLRLMRAVRTNVSPLYAVFFGPCRPLRGFLEEVAEDEPPVRMSDEAGVEHRVWIAEPVDELASWLADQPLLIADGHHRYTTALRYRDEMRERRGGGSWDRVMMLVVDATTEDPPVLPIHRVVVSGPLPGDGERVRSLEEVLAEVDDDTLVYGTVAREGGDLVHRVRRLHGEPPAVCALHRQILGEDVSHLRFTPDPVEAEEAVREGRAVAAFFLPSTNAERIRAVIDRGERLPEKSTFFWPKPRTGLVMRPLD